MSETKQEQFEREAYEEFPGGCKCISTGNGGDCDWCQIYYKGRDYYYGGPETNPSRLLSPRSRERNFTH